jgi:hypothetical protein
MMLALEKGKVVPNWTWTSKEGQVRNIWDWRQKSNVILIVAPKATEEQARLWQTGIEAERKQWLWLNAEIFIITEPPADLPAGVYAMDRYGCWIRTWPLEAWTFEELQREYVYYEARHC